MPPSVVGNSDGLDGLADLERQLQNLSHDTQPLEIIRSFTQKIGKTKELQKLFNGDGVLVRSPIKYHEILENGSPKTSLPS